MDRLVAMQTFVQVAELGSFSGAAQVLKVPNATVSIRVAQLEQHLQVKLLARTTRRVSLTDDGAAYLERVQRLLHELEEVESGLSGATQTPRGRLRVDVPAAAGRHVVAPALPDFLARYPGIVIEIGSSDRPVDLLAEGVDCVIRGGQTHDDSLVARSLGAFEVITCAAPSYLARHGAPATPQDLQHHLCVNFFSAKTGRIFPFEFERNGKKVDITGPHQVAANDADTYVEAGVAGLGILQSPRTRRVQELLDSHRLVPVLTDWSAGRLPLYVMYPRNRHLSARVRVFVDWVLELYAGKFAQISSRDGS
ncbi:MAG: LysR family transcriptional regulator [Betaproteobacteria bacterium]|jgi:LysR family transcriptional regulator for bpeEF and oprC|nr:LysR family transcriptional regulator [Betaproteobacteria bacterium]